MTQLTQGMYGTEYRRGSNLFGLRCGQIGDGVTHNSGWYNKAGQRLGWGDLDVDDFENIALGLEDDELFILLSERDTFWNERLERLAGGKPGKRLDQEAPGVDYVAEHARFIIAPCEVYAVIRSGERQDGDALNLSSRFNRTKTLPAKYVRSESVKLLMAGALAL